MEGRRVEKQAGSERGEADQNLRREESRPQKDLRARKPRLVEAAEESLLRRNRVGANQPLENRPAENPVASPR